MKHEFRKYQHIENDLNSKECQGLLDGIVTIQPKLDGSNCSIWMENDELIICSRNNILSMTKDNHKCYQTLWNDEHLKDFFSDYPNIKLIGEWLAPHRVKYEPDAYYKFYVFDAIYLDEDFNERSRYMHYDELEEILDDYNINNVPSFNDDSGYLKTHNPFDEESGMEYFFSNFLCEGYQDKNLGRYIGEGIVIKNYNYRNPYGRQVWCKIINHKFYSNQRNVKKERIKIDNSQECLFVSENLHDHLLFKKYEEIEEPTIKDTGKFIRSCQLEFIDDYKETIGDLNIKAINNAIAHIAKEFFFEQMKGGTYIATSLQDGIFTLTRQEDEKH